MKISVIIPTYRPKCYIYQCLESLRNQTLKAENYEIIIVLNGCCEPWKSTLETYISSYLSLHNIVLIQTDKGGVSNARNMALDIARGEFIAFIDDDDYVSSSYLEELLMYSSLDCVALSDSIYFDDITSKHNLNNTHHLSYLRNSIKNKPSIFQARVFFNGPCMKLIHHSIIGTRRFNTQFVNGEDNLMMFYISDKIKKIVFTSEKAIYYRRIRSNSATTRKRQYREIVMNSCKIMREYCRYIISNPLSYNIPFVASRFAAEVKSIFH